MIRIVILNSFSGKSFFLMRFLVVIMIFSEAQFFTTVCKNQLN